MRCLPWRAKISAKPGWRMSSSLRARSKAFPCRTIPWTSIISNCVINLSADKDSVLREAFRVLKPGGRFAVSDVVVHGEVPAEVRESVLLWVGCIAGALQDDGVFREAGGCRIRSH